VGQGSYQRNVTVQECRMLHGTGRLPKFTSVESSRDNSSVDTVTMLWAGRPKIRGYIPCRGKRFISVRKRPHQGWFFS